MTIQTTLSHDVLYQGRVALNPKHWWNQRPNCRLSLRRDGVEFDTQPPLQIPYSEIHSAEVRGVVDGVLEHGHQRTVFHCASMWGAPGETAQIIKAIHHIQAQGVESFTPQRVGQQFGALQNYWAFWIVALIMCVTGGAVGGFWGALAGMWAQWRINRRPASWIKKAGICLVALLGCVLAYSITVLMLARLFPGFFKRP